jgi:uncharacterized protein
MSSGGFASGGISIAMKQFGRLVGALALAVSVCSCSVLDNLAAMGMSAGPNGPETPATLGVPYERVSIPSGPRHLDGYLVRANEQCDAPSTLLIYHGVGETISQWVQAQQFLYQNCVSSIVFDYTGSGDSSGPASYRAINADATAAYDFAQRAFAGDTCLYVLGHSMGNGPMLYAAGTWAVEPDGIVVANAFGSLRAATSRIRSWGVFAGVMPNWWDNVDAVREVQAPVLIVHSDADAVNPIGEGQMIFDAANNPKTIAILSGLPHNALYREPNEAWWGPVLQFVGARSAC